VRRIDRLIGDLMSVVRVSDLIYEEISLEALIRNSVTGMSELAKRKEVTVETHLPSGSRAGGGGC
jgi:signal transduction histidine kinase